jgi:Cu(I)/Ag(I) efflux system membrane fusion protein
MTNKVVVATFAALIGVSAIAYGAYRFGVSRNPAVQHPTNEAASRATTDASRAGATTDKRVLYWHDPMVPGQKFDKPGKSPFMDMQLVPVYADSDSEEGAVTINPRIQQNLGVRVSEVTKGTMTQTVEAVGNVAYNERAVAVVTARANGYVEHLYVRAPLDPVRTGQALADIFAPDWLASQEEYLSVKRMQGQGTEGLVSAARQRMLLAGNE